MDIQKKIAIYSQLRCSLTCTTIMRGQTPERTKVELEQIFDDDYLYDSFNYAVETFLMEQKYTPEEVLN